MQMTTSGSNNGRIIGAAALIALLSACSDKEATQVAPKPTAKPALTVRAVQAAPAQWTRMLAANGSVLPWQEAVISSQLPGLRIMEVKAGIGDRVRQGDVLVTLGNRTPSGGNYIQGRVVSPDDGVISAANANVGSTVQSGAELFRLIRKGRLEWRAELTADELMRLRRGMKARVMLVGGRTLNGNVRAISPSVDPKTRYGYALVSLDDSNGVIAGAFARGTFDVSGARKVRWLPASAVLQRGSQSHVLEVDAEGRVHERAVEIGQRKEARIEISKGLQANVPVVESGGAFLTEGDLVRVVKE